MKVYNNSEFLNQLKDDIINKRQSVFLTGSAGVGKTTLLQTLKEELDRVGMNTVLTSTTGLSAFNLGGVTIHKFMGINIQKDVSYLKYFRYLKHHLHQLSLYIYLLLFLRHHFEILFFHHYFHALHKYCRLILFLLL